MMAIEIAAGKREVSDHTRSPCLVGEAAWRRRGTGHRCGRRDGDGAVRCRGRSPEGKERGGRPVWSGPAYIFLLIEALADEG